MSIKSKTNKWFTKSDQQIKENWIEDNDGSSRLVTVPIIWMHCSSCATIIEMSLKNIYWIKSINVNFATEKAIIKYDPKYIDIKDIQQTIIDSWYKIGFQDDHDDTVKRNHEIKIWFLRFIIWALFSIPLVLMMIYDFVDWVPYENIIMPYSAIIWLLLASPVQFIIWMEFYKWFWSALKVRTFNMYSLISIWTTVSFIFSMYSLYVYYSQTWSIIWLNGMKIPSIYFEISALLITFVCLGKLLEAKAKWKVTEAISKLIWLAPKIAFVKYWKSYKEKPIDQVKIWDIVLVRPWEKVPVDWVVNSWNSSIDESMLTWESVPVDKIVWSKVFAWTINKFWSIEFIVTKVWSETALSQIVKLIEQAQWSKAPIQSIADRISAFFVPIVIFIAIITFLIWYYIVWGGFEVSILAFSSVILIACPCALWLATPTAIMVWTWIWAKNWMLIKWWEPLEMTCKIDTIVFDKTWTITEWKPIVTDIISLSDKSNFDILSLAWSLEIKSEHPLAKAIVEYVNSNDINIYDIKDFQAIPWHGIKWILKWKNYLIGTKLFLQSNKINIEHNDKISKLEEQWKTVIYLAETKKLIWIIAVADSLKSTSLSAINRIKELWINVYMITWDNSRVARFIADQVWIQQENVISEVLPHNKSQEIKKLQEKWFVVAMVWDWINDAPALTQADLWIVMWSWVDIAMESWSIIIMRNDLNDVVSSIQLSKETVGKIKQNLFFSLFYNVLWIPIAAWLFTKFGMMLKPELAWLAMALSSVSVITNSLLLRWFKPWKINILSKIAPIIMSIFFIILFLWFVRFSNVWQVINVYTKSNSWIVDDINKFLSTNRSKIIFDKLWLPKIFVYVDKLPINLQLTEWTRLLEDNEVVIWYKEAQMMIREKLFKNVWDEISWFFWIDKVKIVGILSPTNTFIDEVHIMRNSNYDEMITKEDIYMVQDSAWDLEVYYLYDEKNIPNKFKSLINIDDFSYEIEWKIYIPMYLWFDEAILMKKEVSEINDKFEEFIYMWSFKKTYSALDMMHFVPKTKK